MRTFCEGKTRAEIAAELVERLKRGPAKPIDTGEAFTFESAAALYRVWAESHILPDVEALLARDLKPGANGRTR